MTEIIHVGGGGLPATTHSTDDLVEQFLADAQIRENSKTKYRKSLKKYFKWIQSRGIELKNVTLTELLQYRADLEAMTSQRSGTKLSSFTIGAYLMAVKVFYNWGESKGLMFNPGKALKSPERQKKFKRRPLTTDQANQLLDYFETQSPRDFAIVNLMVLTGLRTIEVVRPNIGDIKTLDGIRVLYIQGKGKSEADNYVKLVDSAYFPIQKYIATRANIVAEAPLFASAGVIGASGGRLIPGTISEMVKAGLRAIGLNDPSLTAHSLRHTAGTTVIDMGGSIKDVQNMHRHADSKTSEGYAEMALERKRLMESSGENILDRAFGGRKSQSGD
jgi:integrase/recombinase XerD